MLKPKICNVMPKLFPATFYTRLFRLLIIIGVITACLVSSVIATLDITGTRRLLIENLSQEVLLTAGMAAVDMKSKPFAGLAGLNRVFPHIRGLKTVCIYNQENLLVQHWQAETSKEPCPALVRETGMKDTLSTVIIAEPIKSDNAYLGIVYAEADLISVDTLLRRACLILLSFLLVSLTGCAVAAHYGSRHLNHLMDAIRQQIECLKHNASECLLPAANATNETMALFEAIRSLRMHLMTSLVPRETVMHLRLWYDNIFFNLFSLLRHRIPSDSTILPILSDCDLLLRLHEEEGCPESEVADISRLVDEGFASARALNPPSKQVHMIVSFKPGFGRQWKVQPSYLRALIRHLLLIALARTSRGAICLRLEIVPHNPGAHGAQLAWRLEDSGPPLQPGILRSRLAAMPYRLVSINEASWLLAVQLTKRQGGTIHGENLSGGLLLRGAIQLGYPGDAGHDSPPPFMPLMQANAYPRLILLAGEPSEELHRLCRMFEDHNCTIFWAATPVQALELAPAMPFSAILFNAFSYSRDGHAIVRQILALMQNKLMPAVPVWILTASDRSLTQNDRNDVRATEILLAPVKQDKIASLCRKLIPFNADFWSVCDPSLFQEYSGMLEDRLPEMRAELMAQGRRVQAAIAMLTGQPVPSEVMQNVHTLKSGALALGYMRLATLMANLEYILINPQATHGADNISVIADCLKVLRLE